MLEFVSAGDLGSAGMISLLSCLIRLTWVEVRFTHTYVYKHILIFYGHMQDLR